MIEYKISYDEQGNCHVESDIIVAGSIAVNIPDEDKRKQTYTSFFLHKADIEEGLFYLESISCNNAPHVNRALFMSALTNMIKCFQSSEACPQLNEKRFAKKYPAEGKELARYRNWRNKHFVHDENSMRETISFLLVAPEHNDSLLGGPPSVIWNRFPINYIEEKNTISKVMCAIKTFLISEIDKMGDSIYATYNEKKREELLSYGQPSFLHASISNPEKTRNASLYTEK